MTDTSKIILDVDTGTDDAMAIILAMRALKDRLMAITVTHGNQPLPCTLENTLRVVELMGGGVPVYGGMRVPMVQDLMPGRFGFQRHQRYTQEHDGEKVSVHDPYLPLPPATLKPEPQHAVSFLVDTLRNTPEPITVVSVGPLSNLGMALRMAPDIAKNIKRLILMGGGDRDVNLTSAAELNFFKDPEAAQIVVHAPCPIVIFPLDATTSIVFRESDAERIMALDNPCARFYADLLLHFIERLRLLGIAYKDDPNDFSMAMHDALCILYLLDPTLVTDLRRRNVDVDFGGSLCDGRMVVESRVYVPLEGDVQVAYQLNKEKAMSLLLQILA